MANKQYNRGRLFEWQVKKDLEERGYFCTRSSGSHGAVDIVAIGMYDILLVQCKIGGVMTQKDKDGLIGAAKHEAAIPIVADKMKKGNRTWIQYKWLMADGRVKDWRAGDEPPL